MLFFSLRPANITVWNGKIINPLFLIFFAILGVVALVKPGASISAVEPAAAYESGALFSSIIEGYGTMDAFARMFPKGPSYKIWAIIFTVFSFCVSNFGLSRITDYSLPVLMFLYPLAITLILLALGLLIRIVKNRGK